MTMPELLLIAIGLSMDAFSVAICKGLSLQTTAHRFRCCLICGIYFGFFQALMPSLGWLLGVRFQVLIAKMDHWVAFLLLTLLGLAMIRDSCEHTPRDTSPSFTPRAMLPFAIATSMDALTVGITFAFLQVHILSAVVFIGITTFTLSCIGVWIGSIFGDRFREKSCLFGGAILIFMGFKTLLTHLHLFPL